jgi:hypothetical protein
MDAARRIGNGHLSPVRVDSTPILRGNSAPDRSVAHHTRTRRTSPLVHGRLCSDPVVTIACVLLEREDPESRRVADGHHPSQDAEQPPGSHPEHWPRPRPRAVAPNRPRQSEVLGLARARWVRICQVDRHRPFEADWLVVRRQQPGALSRHPRTQPATTAAAKCTRPGESGCRPARGRPPHIRQLRESRHHAGVIVHGGGIVLRAQLGAGRRATSSPALTTACSA